ncbi:hypothetical protein Tco_1514578 [Tanacetum coccineum]
MLAPSGGGLILYQAYGNLYAMTGRKAYLFEDKQIPSVGVFDEVFLALGWHLEEIHVTWDHLKKKQTRLRTCCDNHDLSRVGNQSIERDRLIGIGLVMDLVKFLSFTFGGKEMTFVVLAFLR